MWVCQHCHTENKDSLTICPACGTARPVRRFGSAPQSQQPSVSPAPRVTASVPNQADEAARTAAKSAKQAQDQQEDEYDEEEEYERPRQGGSVFGKIVGGLLIVLLPLIVGLLAWRQYDVLTEALLPLYLTEKAPDWLRSVFYGIHVAAAVLLSMLPGLWTILLSRKPPKED